MGLILGHHLPFGIGGGGPAGPGYVFGGQSGLLVQGDGSNPPGPYTVGAPGGTAPGDLLVCWAAAGPGYPGQSNVFLQSDFGGFPVWSTTGGISQLDTGIGRVVLTIQPRIATGDFNDNVRMLGIGGWPVALQMVLFKRAWTFGLGSITAQNTASENKPDPLLIREVASATGFNHLVDVFATVKKATIGMIGATTGVDASQPTIVVLSSINYQDNGFGQGMVGVFGYRISAVGNPGIPVGNWFSSLNENNDSYAVNARWKSVDS